MKKVERIGISVEKKLLSGFDRLVAKKGYPNRSEAVRDLIRDSLSQEQLADPKTEVVGAVFLAYDHHSTKLTQRLLELQHNHYVKTISSMHVHLDKHDCLEIIVLRGKVGEINKMAEGMISLKGVKLGRINFIAADSL